MTAATLIVVSLLNLVPSTSGDTITSSSIPVQGSRVANGTAHATEAGRLAPAAIPGWPRWTCARGSTRRSISCRAENLQGGLWRILVTYQADRGRSLTWVSVRRIAR